MDTEKDKLNQPNVELRNEYLDVNEGNQTIDFGNESMHFSDEYVYWLEENVIKLREQLQSKVDIHQTHLGEIQFIPKSIALDIIEPQAMEFKRVLLDPHIYDGFDGVNFPNTSKYQLQDADVKTWETELPALPVERNFDLDTEKFPKMKIDKGAGKFENNLFKENSELLFDGVGMKIYGTHKAKVYDEETETQVEKTITHVEFVAKEPLNKVKFDLDLNGDFEHEHCVSHEHQRYVVEHIQKGMDELSEILDKKENNTDEFLIQHVKNSIDFLSKKLYFYTDENLNKLFVPLVEMFITVSNTIDPLSRNLESYKYIANILVKIEKIIKLKKFIPKRI